MIRRLFRFALKLGAVGSVVAVAAKVLERRRSAPSDWTASTEPWPPVDLSDRQASDPATGGPDLGAVAHDAEGEAIAAETVEDDPSAPAGTDGPEVWVEPNKDGECPTSHPVKAKLSSGVFHLPGMANYERTNADRCYPDAHVAEADGLRQARH